MVLRKVNLQSVVDDDEGFLLSRMSRSSVEYSEGDHVLCIEVESGEDDKGNYNLGIYWPMVLTWQSPNEKVFITKTKRQEIKNRVDRSLKALDIPAWHIDVEL
jgi:hypothetical protein